MVVSSRADHTLLNANIELANIDTRLSALGGKRHAKRYPSGVDVSSILVLPFSAMVAFATLAWAALTKRQAPRLVWPCAFSTAVVALVFLKPPHSSEMGLWTLGLLSLAFAAAIGTVLGGAVARVIVRAMFRSRR